MPLAVLSAGAAKAVVEGLAPDVPGGIVATFGAVGTIREQFLAGARCDVLILTQAMIAELAAAGRLDPASIAPLGNVHTGVAVPDGVALPAIGGRAALTRVFGEATALYCPDIERATAGIHFVRVLRELELYPALASRLRAYPSGAIAMRALADAADARAVGCTQVTEILYTPGVTLVGRLPDEFALATVYSAAVSSEATSPAAARPWLEKLTGTASATMRRHGGFEPLGPAFA